MTTETVLAAGCAGLAVVVLGAPRAAARSRLQASAPARGGRRSRSRWLAVARVGACAAGLLLAHRLLGGQLLLAGLAPAGLVALLRRSRARAARRRDRAAVAAELPRFADLLAGCLDAGAAPADALDVVRANVGGAVSARLASTAVALRAGADPLAAYAAGLSARGGPDGDDPVRDVVRALSHALQSGAPLAASVAAVGREQRRRTRWAAEAAARRAGVLAVGPLVVCFLPAFVLLGVLPVVIGVAGAVLGDLR